MAGRRRRSTRCTCRVPATPISSASQKYELTDVRDVLERASARETAARVAGGALCKAFLRGARRRGRLARAPDRLGRARRATRSRSRSRTSPRSTRRRCAASTRRRAAAMVERHRRAAQGQRVARRRLRGAGLRARARASARTSPGRSASTGVWRGRSARSRRSRASALGEGFALAGLPGSQAHDEIFYSRRARLLPRDQSRRAVSRAA